MFNCDAYGVECLRPVKSQMLLHHAPSMAWPIVIDYFSCIFLVKKVEKYQVTVMFDVVLSQT